MIGEKSAGAVIFYLKHNNPLFLMLKYTNYWGFVKGKVEKNEQELETVRREAKEEANISELKFLKGFRQAIRYFFKSGKDTINKEVIFFLAEVSEEEAKKVKISFEHEDFKWLSFDEASKIIRHKNEKALLIVSKEFIDDYLKQARLF